MSLKWSLVELPEITDPRGKLGVVEGGREVPFAIARVYYLYDTPTGLMRAGHAHRNLHQLMISLTGSFEIHLDDGVNKETISMRKVNSGLLIKPMVWRELENFSSGTVCLVLASLPYTESDYIRDYGDFRQTLESC